MENGEISGNMQEKCVEEQWIARNAIFHNAVLDADEEADCASIGVSSRDDGGDDAHSIILIICTNGKTEMTDAGWCSVNAETEE